MTGPGHTLTDVLEAHPEGRTEYDQIDQFPDSLSGQNRCRMGFKKSMLILILAIFLISIASVCAADANDVAIASEDTNQMDLSSNNVIS